MDAACEGGCFISGFVNNIVDVCLLKKEYNKVGDCHSRGGTAMSGTIKKMICMLVCAAALCLLMSAGRVSGTAGGVSIYSDENGRFYTLSSERSGFVLDCYNGSGEKTRTASESVEALELLLDGTDVYVVCSFDGAAGIFRPFVQGDNMVIAENTMPKPGCSAVCGGRVYITDSRDDKHIRIYDDINDDYESIAVSQSVEALLVCEGRLIAVLSDGVFSAANGRKTKCEVPQQPFVRSGEIFCDSQGGVFRLSDDKGFERLCTTGYGNTVYCRGELYALDGKELLRLDMNGEVTARLSELPYGADEVVTSGESLAVLCGNKPVPVDKKAFVPISVEESSTEQVTGQSSIPEQSSRRDNDEQSREESFDQSSTRNDIKLISNEYEIRAGYIFGVPEGTTVAGLKRALVYPGELGFRDYRGRTVSSGRIGTGSTVTLYNDGESAEVFKIVVSGDLTGEGNINTSDIGAMTKHLCEEKRLEGAALYAADINDDSSLDIRDLYLLHRIIYS